MKRRQDRRNLSIEVFAKLHRPTFHAGLHALTINLAHLSDPLVLEIGECGDEHHKDACQYQNQRWLAGTILSFLHFTPSIKDWVANPNARTPGAGNVIPKGPLSAIAPKRRSASTPS